MHDGVGMRTVLPEVPRHPGSFHSIVDTLKTPLLLSLSIQVGQYLPQLCKVSRSKERIHKNKTALIITVPRKFQAVDTAFLSLSY